ncbi:PAS domain S-box protein [Rubrobacter tropicus]|uniref:PAS domain S-box protein n=1 Tax=Rubrobacter tropicus TaxID=2653851 RepID=UPI001407310C|nr:PAS domain S-box protein [Rubrobacter tropicus]
MGEGGTVGVEGYDVVFGLARAGAASVDPDTGRFLRVNPEMVRIAGYPWEELLGLTFADITHLEDRNGDFERFRRMVRG